MLDEKIEELKMQMLRDRAQLAKAEIEAGATTGGDAFFDELLAETGKQPSAGKSSGRSAASIDDYP